MEKDCGTCEGRDACVIPCKAVDKILWKDNRVMEKKGYAGIYCYPQNHEVHFSEITEENRASFSGEDVIPWSGGDFRLRKTTVFVERFFNKVPCKELAERFGVKENTIVCMYAQAVEQLWRMIEAMDARREGLKATKSYNFTDEQKFFLLVAIFGFNAVEVSKMFGQDRKMVSHKVKRMSDKYRAVFTAAE